MRLVRPNHRAFSVPDCIGAFADVARPIILRRYPVNRCIAATRIAIEVFNAFGVPAKPMTARFYAGNQLLYDLIGDKRPPTTAEVARLLARGAVGWKIGFDDDPMYTASGWNRHLVAFVDRRWIVDASADQAEKPWNHLVLPRVLVARLDQPIPVHGSTIRLGQPAGMFVEYRFEPKERSFRTAPDWELGHTARLTTSAIIDAMYDILRDREAA